MRSAESGRCAVLEIRRSSIYLVAHAFFSDIWYTAFSVQRTRRQKGLVQEFHGWRRRLLKVIIRPSIDRILQRHHVQRRHGPELLHCENAPEAASGSDIIRQMLAARFQPGRRTSATISLMKLLRSMKIPVPNQLPRILELPAQQLSIAVKAVVDAGLRKACHIMADAAEITGLPVSSSRGRSASSVGMPTPLRKIASASG